MAGGYGRILTPPPERGSVTRSGSSRHGAIGQSSPPSRGNVLRVTDPRSGDVRWQCQDAVRHKGS